MKSCFILTAVLISCMVSYGQARSTQSDLSQAYENTEHPISVFAAPLQDLIVIQYKGFNSDDLIIVLKDASGSVVQQTVLYKGSTIAWFSTQALYEGIYTVDISSGNETITQTINLKK